MSASFNANALFYSKWLIKIYFFQQTISVTLMCLGHIWVDYNNNSAYPSKIPRVTSKFTRYTHIFFGAAPWILYVELGNLVWYVAPKFPVPNFHLSKPHFRMLHCQKDNDHKRAVSCVDPGILWEGGELCRPRYQLWLAKCFGNVMYSRKDVTHVWQLWHYGSY